jgi:hypothetical protein
MFTKRDKVKIIALGMLITSLAMPLTAQKIDSSKPKTTELCSNVPDSSGLSPCEESVIESSQLKQKLFTSEYQQLVAQSQAVADKLKKDLATIEANHPGMTYQQPDANHPLGSLVKIPTKAQVELVKPQEKK